MTYQVMYEQYASPTTFEAENITDALEQALMLGTGKCDCPCGEDLKVTSIKELK